MIESCFAYLSTVFDSGFFEIKVKEVRTQMCKSRIGTLMSQIVVKNYRVNSL